MMIKRMTQCLLILAMFATTMSALAAKGKTWDDPKKAIAEDKDFTIQGEYLLKNDKMQTGGQVIALGKGQFRLELFKDGLPGAGWKRGDRQMTLNGKRDDAGNISLKSKDGDHATSATINADGKSITLSGFLKGTLKKIVRKSKTIGIKPPKGAVVLFNSKNVDQWKKGAKMTKDGLLMQGVTSKQNFGSYKLHIEFRLPYQPEARGQGRGNSGIYNQGKYEVQMLDSFGLDGKNNECGGIYTVAPPIVNMCFPPLTWQTYDIEFTAAKYDKDGKRTSPPSLTVKHNNVLVHKGQKLTKGTTASPVKSGSPTGPIFLQNHGNPVRYRNIWVLPVK